MYVWMHGMYEKMKEKYIRFLLFFSTPACILCSQKSTRDISREPSRGSKSLVKKNALCTLHLAFKEEMLSSVSCRYPDHGL